MLLGCDQRSAVGGSARRKILTIKIGAGKIKLIVKESL